MADGAQEHVILIFKADFSADPLWRQVPGRPAGMVKLERLPLSDDLKHDLRAWARQHDEMFWPPDPADVTQAELDAWRQASHDLVARLRAELGPDFTVINSFGD